MKTRQPKLTSGIPERGYPDVLASIKQTQDFREFRRMDALGDAIPLDLQWRRVTLAGVLIKLAVQRLMQSCPDNIHDGFREAYADDYPVPLFLFDQNSVLPRETAFDATVYYCVEMLLYQHLEKLRPLDTSQIEAKRAMDGDKPLNLTSIYINTQVFLRKAAIGEMLAKEIPGMALCRCAYKALIALHAKNPFDHSGGSAERSILITELAFYVIGLDRLFQETYYDRIVTDQHNAICFEVIDRFRRDLTDCAAPDPWNAQWSGHIATTARGVVEYFDNWGLGNSNEEDAPPDVTSDGGGRGGCIDLSGVFGARQMNGRAFGRTAMICGREVDIEYEQPLSAPESWERTTGAITSHIEAIDCQLARILSERTESDIRQCQETGDVYWPDFYRREGDIRIFEDNYRRPSSQSAFYVVLLQDCSCSINPEKRALLTPLLCLLVNVVLNRPENFIHLAAYQQHSSGNKRVTLRRCIDMPTGQILDPSPAIHLAQSGVNYDAFALAEVVQTHCQDYLGPDPVRNETVLAMVVGDFWPVSQTGQDTARETREVYQHLRASYPNLVLCGIGVNPQYSGESLYDHFVSLKAQDPLSAFSDQFTRMIDNIVTMREKQS